MKEIKVDVLSRKSVMEAKNQIRQYKKDLENKLERFANRLKSEGFQILNLRVTNIPPVYRGDTTPDVVINKTGKNSYEIRLSISGSECTFVEFGTGVTFNGAKGSSPHPKGAELGMTIGNYGKGQGAKSNGWFFRNKYGDIEHTYGIPMQAPLYYTSKEIKQKIKSIALEVWSE